MKQKSLLASKVNWTNIVGFIVVLLAYLGEQSIIPVATAGFIVFVLNVILQKFFSQVKGSAFFYAVNVLGAIVMIAEYLLNNHLWDIPPALLSMTIFVLNLVLRTFFTQSKEIINSPGSGI